jgi:hypothetical protein
MGAKDKEAHGPAGRKGTLLPWLGANHAALLGAAGLITAVVSLAVGVQSLSVAARMIRQLDGIATGLDTASKRITNHLAHISAELERTSTAGDVADATAALDSDSRREVYLSQATKRAAYQEGLVNPPSAPGGRYTVTDAGHDLLRDLDSTLVERLAEDQRKHPGKPLGRTILDEANLLDLRRAIGRWNREGREPALDLYTTLGVINALLGQGS